MKRNMSPQVGEPLPRSRLLPVIFATLLLTLGEAPLLAGPRNQGLSAADQKFVDATAIIDGDFVVVSSPDVPKPIVVRFGWHEEAEPNLSNAAGLPALPFRTDKW